MMAKKLMWTGIVAGSLFCVAALAWGTSEWIFGNVATATTGTVVEVRVDTRDRLQRFDPIVEYLPGQTEPVTFTGKWTSNRYAVGQTVPVIYLPADPQSARIDQFDQRWAGMTTCAIFSAVSLIVACVSRMILLSGNRARDTRIDLNESSA